MKTNGTLIKALLICFLSLTCAVAVAQPDYRFRNSTLVSGAANEPGAVYRFTNVKTGVDAIVRINAVTTDVKVIDFDDNRNGGFEDAFQPRIQAKGKTNGYAEFNIAFVIAGTNIPAIMALVNPTSIDVDGTKSARDSMFEYDEYLTPGSYLLDYDLIGTDLQFIYKAGSVTGKNKRGVEKDLIDTLAKEAMFGVIYPAITNFTVRIGLDNQLSGSTTRQRSVYFMRFAFANSFLPINNLVSFTGNRNQTGEVNLFWNMNSGHDYQIAGIEKSDDGKNFYEIGTVTMTSKLTASFTDQSKNSGSYYRLKMTAKSGKQSYSTVLFIRGASSNKMAVYPTLVNDNANISYITDNGGNVNIYLFDQSGRLVLQKNYTVQQGTNSIALNGLSKLATGQYIVKLQGKDGSSYTQRIQLIN